MRFLPLLILLIAGNGLGSPKVETSFVPLQEISAAIMGDIASPGVIIDGNASAHHFALKPSHLSRLQQADLVIWLDDHFESGFHNLNDSLPASTRRLQLMPLIASKDRDGHVWYSPARVSEVAGLIAKTLEDLDPGNQSIYRKNQATLSAALTEWRGRVVNQGLPSTNNVITDHDFLRHFVHDFGIAPVPSIHDSHDDHGGLKEVGRLEKEITSNDISCLVALEYPLSPLAQRLVNKYQLEVVNLTAVEIERDLYTPIVGRLDRLVRALQACPG